MLRRPFVALNIDLVKSRARAEDMQARIGEPVEVAPMNLGTTTAEFQDRELGRLGAIVAKAYRGCFKRDAAFSVCTQFG
jgi:hypothetical protein